MNRSQHAFRFAALAFVVGALVITNPAAAGNPVTFTITAGSGKLNFFGGAFCPSSSGFDSGGPTGFQTTGGSAKPLVHTTIAGTSFVASCHGTTSGGGGGSAVIITLTFAGSNLFTIDATQQTFQLGNTYTVKVQETGGLMRTCISNPTSPIGDYQLIRSSPIVGFPRLWPSDSVGAANPGFAVTGLT